MHYKLSSWVTMKLMLIYRYVSIYKLRMMWAVPKVTLYWKIFFVDIVIKIIISEF